MQWSLTVFGGVGFGATLDNSITGETVGLTGTAHTSRNRFVGPTLGVQYQLLPSVHAGVQGFTGAFGPESHVTPYAGFNISKSFAINAGYTVGELYEGFTARATFNFGGGE